MSGAFSRGDFNDEAPCSFGRLCGFAGHASAQHRSSRITFDVGGKFDKSFNEAAYNGAEAFKKKTGIAYRDFEIQNDAPARAA